MSRPPARRRSCLKSTTGADDETGDVPKVNGNNEATGPLPGLRKRVSFSAKNHVKEYMKDVSSDVIDSSDPPMDMSMIEERANSTVGGEMSMDMTVGIEPNVTFCIPQVKPETGASALTPNPNTTFIVDAPMEETKIGEGTFIKHESGADREFSSPVLAGHMNERQADTTEDPEIDFNKSTYSPQDMSMSPVSPGLESKCADMSMTVHHAEQSRLADSSRREVDMSLTFNVGESSLRKKTLKKNLQKKTLQGAATSRRRRSIAKADKTNDEMSARSIVEEEAENMSLTVFDREISMAIRQSPSSQNMSMTVNQPETSLTDPTIGMELTYAGHQRSLEVGRASSEVTSYEPNLSISETNGCLEMEYTTLARYRSVAESPARANESAMSMATAVSNKTLHGDDDGHEDEMSMVDGESVRIPSPSGVSLRRQITASRYGDFSSPDMSMTRVYSDSIYGGVSRTIFKDLTKTGDMSMTMCEPTDLAPRMTNDNTKTGDMSMTVCRSPDPASNATNGQTRTGDMSMTVCRSPDRPSNVTNGQTRIGDMSMTVCTSPDHASGLKHGQTKGGDMSMTMCRSTDLPSNVTNGQTKGTAPETDKRKPILNGSGKIQPLFQIKEHVILTEQSDSPHDAGLPVRQASKPALSKARVHPPGNSAFGKFGYPKTPKRALPLSMFSRNVAAVASKEDSKEVKMKSEEPAGNLPQYAKKLTVEERPIISAVPVEVLGTGDCKNDGEIVPSGGVNLNHKQTQPTKTTPIELSGEDSATQSKVHSKNLKQNRNPEAATALVAENAVNALRKQPKPHRGMAEQNIPPEPKDSTVIIAPELKNRSPRKADLKRSHIQSHSTERTRSPQKKSALPLSERNMQDETLTISPKAAASPVKYPVVKQPRVLSPKISKASPISSKFSRQEQSVLRDADASGMQSPAEALFCKGTTFLHPPDVTKLTEVSHIQVEKASVIEEPEQPKDVSLFDRTTAEACASDITTVAASAPHCDISGVEQGLDDMSIEYQDLTLFDESAIQAGPFSDATVQRPRDVTVSLGPPFEILGADGGTEMVQVVERGTGSIIITNPDLKEENDEENEEEEEEEEKEEDSFLAFRRQPATKISPKRAQMMDESSPFFETTTVDSTPTGPIMPALPPPQAKATLPPRPPLSQTLQISKPSSSSILSHREHRNRRATRGPPANLGSTLLGSTFVANPVAPPPLVLKKLVQVKSLCGYSKVKLLSEIFADAANLSDDCFAYIINDLRGSADETYLDAETKRRKLEKFKGLVYDPADPLSPIAVFSKTWLKLMSADKK